MAVRRLPVVSTLGGLTLDRGLPLRAGVPVADACALVVAVAVAGIAPWTIAYACIVFVGLHLDPARAGRIDPRLSTDAGWLVARVAAPLIVLMPAAAALGADPDWATLCAVAVALLLAGRGLMYAASRRARRQGVLAEPTLIVGSGEVADRLAGMLADHPEYGMRLLGSVDTDGRSVGSVPMLGDPHDLEALIETHGVRRVLITFGVSDRDLVATLRSAERTAAEFHVVPRLWEAGAVAGAGGNVDDVWGIPIVQLRRPMTRSRDRLVKRCFDVVGASLLLLLTAPLLLALAAAVRLSGPGPILFRQKRVGLDGTLFEILKFRSMHEIEDSDTRWTVDGDDGVTRVGRVLRATSLDELPQLWNVMRGEMSLVGPRPERPHFADSFAATIPRYDDRHRVRAGLTGLPQVSGLRGDTSIEDRVRMDNAYIEGWSLWSDCTIVLRTVRCVLTGAGE
jgi:exopolysaccharide biosynthesis polyprenyl glycosylphosphotransferase